MKIIEVIPTLDTGGAERLVCDLSISLSKENEVEVFCLYNSIKTDFSKKLRDNNVKVQYFNKKRGWDLKCFLKIFYAIKNSNAEIVHSHIDSIKYVAIPCIIYNKKLFYTVHNMADKDAYGINRYLNKILFKYFNITPVAIAKKVKKSILDLYNLRDSEVPLIYNGINMEEINESLKYNDFIENDTINIFNVAVFRKQKNHKFLIDIFKESYKENPKLRLYLIGDGILKKDIEKYVKENGLEKVVFFLGNRNDVYNLMKTFDIFMLTSDYEGFSLAILEAMACKKKIIVTDVGGNSEQIINGKTGFLIKKDDINFAVDILKKTLSDKKIHENAYEYLLDNFTIEKAKDKYIKEFKKKLK
ncbi:glycosyltransferase [Clostridium perfringens]